MDQDFGNDIITLVDEEGGEQAFELIDTVELDGVSYMALTPYYEDVTELIEASGELVILKVVEENDGEEVLEPIDNDDEFEKVAATFEERLAEDYDFEKNYDSDELSDENE